AVAAHGYERATRDVDIVFAASAANADRFAAALASLNASVTLADTPEPAGGLTGERLTKGGHLRFATPAGPLDALSALSGLDHATLAARAISADLGEGISVLVAAYEDVVAMKEASGRDADRIDLERLRELRDGASSAG